MPFLVNMILFHLAYPDASTSCGFFDKLAVKLTDLLRLSGITERQWFGEEMVGE